MTLAVTRTHTRTFNATTFADPYKKCLACGDWIDGALDAQGPLVLVPCEHRSGYRDVCPSWSPVDGCWCAESTRRNPDNPIHHEMRTPAAGDSRTY
jgi:hypothetical protein